MVTINAPAKVNLTLEVTGKRSDGYHEVRSVMQAVSLCDTISFKSARQMSFECDMPLWESGKSLVARAAELFKKETQTSGGAIIRIIKRIPLSSGLGGDSSDAAAVLSGLNKLWKSGISSGELVRMAAALGSDVPFFLSGGTALAEGRGEIINPLPDMAHAWMVLLMPHVGRPESKTGGMYSRLNPQYFTDGAMTDSLVTRLTRGEPVRSCDLCNVFEKVAFTAFADLGKYRTGFQKVAGEPVHLAGSGPALFAIFSDAEKASSVWRNLKERGLETYLVESHSSGLL